MSRDAVRRLEQEDHLRELLSRPEGDLISRFPGYLFWRKDFEALYNSYAGALSPSRSTARPGVARSM